MTAQEILNQALLEYRHNFTTAQQIPWFNETQRDIFQMMQMDSEPYFIDLFGGLTFYPLPVGVEIGNIKTVSVQSDDGTGKIDYLNPQGFVEVPFRRNDDNQWASEQESWYTIVGDTIHLNSPHEQDGRVLYIFCDRAPVDLTADTLNEEPSTPVKYQRLLRLGLLKKICAARKDVLMKNNFEAEWMEEIANYSWYQKNQEPEFVTPSYSSLPKNYNNRWMNQRRWS